MNKILRIPGSLVLVMALVMLLISGLACSNSKNDDRAPNSVAGRSFRMTITAGSGNLAATGVGTLAFDADGTTYAATGDGVNTANDNGTYAMTKLAADTIEIVLNSSVYVGLPAITYIFVYTGNKVGAFTTTLGNDTQSGAFAQL